MPSTYSINVGSSTEAHRLATIEDVLNLLPDNLEKLVNPIDVRSVVYSTWENSVFKQLTGSASIEYIGIHRNDIYNKIYFGKKQLSSNDIMSSSLLNSDVDTFFYNTKSDSNLSNQYTKISILSGTNSGWYNIAPYMRSYIAISPPNPVLAPSIIGSSIAVGNTPQGIAFNPISNTMYVCNASSATISVIDCVTNTVISTIILPASYPQRIAYCSVNNTMYIGNAPPSINGNNVFVIDCNTNTLVATIIGCGVALAYNPVNNKMYCCRNLTGVSVIDCNTNTFTNIATPNCSNIDYNSLSNTMYFTTGASGNVVVINCVTNTISSTISIGVNSTSIVYNSLNNTMYVSNPGLSSIKIINCNTNTVTSTITTSGNVSTMIYIPLFNYIYFSNFTLDTVDIIDCNTNLVVNSLPIFSVRYLSYNYLTNIIYVTNQNTANVTLISAPPPVGYSFSQVIQYRITNPSSGNVYVTTDSGRVYINDIGLPTINETIGSASNNAILEYSNGNLSWTFNNYTAASIGTPGLTLSILGNPITVNGYNIELTDSRPIIQDSFNSIQSGQTFSKATLVDVIERMLYSYIPPIVSLSVSPSIGEKGNPPTITVTYTITKETDPVINCQFPSGNVIGFSSPAPINAPGTSIVSGNVTGIAPFGFTSSYIFQVTDSGVSNGNVPTTVSTSATFNLVYPYFWGITSSNAVNASQMNSILSGLSKSVSSKSNKTAIFNGVGYVYFAYPSSYGYLSQILDENTNPVSFTYSIYSGPGLTSPGYYWSNVSYIVYKIGPTTVGFPNSVSWQFDY